jgi:hypothetical protein
MTIRFRLYRSLRRSASERFFVRSFAAAPPAGEAPDP